jgi:hypothetical protein
MISTHSYWLIRVCSYLLNIYFADKGLLIVILIHHSDWLILIILCIDSCKILLRCGLSIDIYAILVMLIWTIILGLLLFSSYQLQGLALICINFRKKCAFWMACVEHIYIYLDQGRNDIVLRCKGILSDAKTQRVVWNLDEFESWLINLLISMSEMCLFYFYGFPLVSFLFVIQNFGSFSDHVIWSLSLLI